MGPVGERAIRLDHIARHAHRDMRAIGRYPVAFRSDTNDLLRHA